jgi:hypothetical protein
MLGRYATRNGKQFQTFQSILMPSSCGSNSPRIFSQGTRRNWRKRLWLFFQGRPTILAFTSMNRSNTGNVSIRSVGISAEMQTEYLPLHVKKVTARIFFPRTEKHYEQCCVDGPLTTMHHKKMTIAPIIPLTDKYLMSSETDFCCCSDELHKSSYHQFRLIT